MTVDQRHAHGEALREAHQRVVDRRVAVGVQLSHHVADDALRSSHAPLSGRSPISDIMIEDASLYRLEPVAGVGQGSRIDDGVRVLEERPLHLVGYVNLIDTLVRCSVLSHRLRRCYPR